MTDLLLELRLAEWLPAQSGEPPANRDDPGGEEVREQGVLRLLPAAGRFLPTLPGAADTVPEPQGSLW